MANWTPWLPQQGDRLPQCNDQEFCFPLVFFKHFDDPFCISGENAYEKDNKKQITLGKMGYLL